MLGARVYCFSQNDSCEIQGANTNISYTILPNASLVIKPGIYSLWWGDFCLKQDGLYRMINSKLQRTFQTIVYANNVDELIASISKVFLYGTQDHKFKA